MSAKRVHEVMAERMRERIWADVAPPPEMLQRALNTMAAKLTAKKRTYITFQGAVTKVLEDDDHDSQLKAADQIAKIAGAHIRERDVAPTQPAIRLRYDPASGVSEIIIGDVIDADQPALPNPSDERVLPPGTPSTPEEREVQLSLPLSAAAPPREVIDNVVDRERFAERLIARRGGYDAAFRRRLFDEIEREANDPT